MRMLLLAVALLGVAFAQNASFIVDGYNSTWVPQPGYVLASLSDIQSMAFATYYNNQGLTDMGETINGCCAFRVVEGYLTFGNVSDGNFSLIGPWTNQGENQCGVNDPLVNPVWFGTMVTGGFPSQDIGPIDVIVTQYFTTVPEYSTDGYCPTSPSVTTWGIYKQSSSPPPGPPSGWSYALWDNMQAVPSGYWSASLADVQSAGFAAFYNANNGIPTYNAFNGIECCFLNTSDGILLYGGTSGSYLAPYQGAGIQCIADVPAQNNYIFGCVGGQFEGMYWPTLNSTVQNQYSTIAQAQPPMCQEPNMLQIIKTNAAPPGPPTPAPPSPPGGSFAIYQSTMAPPSGYRQAGIADIQSSGFVSFYNSNNGIPTYSAFDSVQCCVFNTTDGFLVLGQNTTISDVSYMAPFDNTGTLQCLASVPSDTTYLFGAVQGQYSMDYFAQVNSTFVAMINTVAQIASEACSVDQVTLQIIVSS